MLPFECVLSTKFICIVDYIQSNARILYTRGCVCVYVRIYYVYAYMYIYLYIDRVQRKRRGRGVERGTYRINNINNKNMLVRVFTIHLLIFSNATVIAI